MAHTQHHSVCTCNPNLVQLRCQVAAEPAMGNLLSGFIYAANGMAPPWPANVGFLAENVGQT